MSSVARPLVALAASLLALGGCSSLFGTQDTTPGDPIGTFALVAAVDDTSTCAELAASAPRPWDFSIKLRHDGTTAYWVTSSGSIAGTLATSTGSFAFSTTETIAVHDAIPAQGLGACSIIRTDDFSGTFAGDPTTSVGSATLTGSLRYGYVITTGSDCRDLIDGATTTTNPLAAYDPTPQPVSHGAFTSLPCYVRFDVTGTRSATE